MMSVATIPSGKKCRMLYFHPSSTLCTAQCTAVGANFFFQAHKVIPEFPNNVNTCIGRNQSPGIYHRQNLEYTVYGPENYNSTDTAPSPSRL